MAVIVGTVFVGDVRRGGGKRYRPGRPFEFRPVWFLSSPEQVTAGRRGTAGQISGGNAAEQKALRTADSPVALPAGPARDSSRGDWPGVDPTGKSATGGASDRW
jgi:hypothetical protein